MEPKKHHYIPVFYLKRWAGSDDRVCEFSIPYKTKIKPRRVFPSMTAYEAKLYQLNGFPENLAQQVEANFFQKVDCCAANVLAEVEATNGKVTWDADKRSNWTRFILSLLLRCPEDLPLLRKKFLSEFTRTADIDEDRYRVIRDLGDPETFSRFSQVAARSPDRKELF